MRRKPRNKAQRALDAAYAAGEKYAYDQLQTDLFHDWVWDQMIEGEEMRRETPDAVLPLKTKHDYGVVAKNMLDMLSHDIDRGLDHREVVELIGTDDADAVKEFWSGLHDELRKPDNRAWLADELLAPMQAEIEAGPRQRALPGIKELGRRRMKTGVRDERSGAIDWDEGPASQGQWFGRVGGRDAYVITTNTSDEARRATGLAWGGYALARVTPGGDRHIGYFRTRGIAQSQASSDLVAARTQGVAPQTWAEARKRGGKNERERDPDVYLSFSEGMYRVIQHGVPISADKKTAEEALRVAEHFRLTVSDRMWNGDTGQWVSMRDHLQGGLRRPVREDPRDHGYDPQSKAGPRNFPRLHREVRERGRRRR